MHDMKETIHTSVTKLEKWLQDHQYRGYDPADGLTSYLRPLTFGNLLLDRLLQQLIWRSPVNLRPLLGVRKKDSCIGRGYIARAYLLMFKMSGDVGHKHKASACLDWLIDHKAPGFSQYSWGKMFDFASRGGRVPKFEPITVWTSLIGQAFLDGYEILGEKKYLEVADSVCQWLISVPRTRTDSGTCINYVPQPGTCTIHNQSMLAAAMLTRTAKLNGRQEYLEVAREAIAFTCSRQRPDGSWFYGETSDRHWIDNFHTGYNLDALKSYVELTGDKTHAEALRLGFSFYKDHFFEKNGRPKYYHNRTYPVDSQCAAQAIDTLAYFSDYDEEALELAAKVAKWTIDNMQDPTGYFYYARYPFAVLKVPMIHWAQATTFKALAYLLTRIR
jgi:hypothetical protein